MNNAGWCAPTEVLYGPDVPPLWDDDGALKALCLPCETGGVEHPLNPWCAGTLAREWVEHAERTYR